MRTAMFEPELAPLVSEAVDRLDRAMMNLRLWLLDRIRGASFSTAADQKRAADRKDPETLAAIDRGASKPHDTEPNRP